MFTTNKYITARNQASGPSNPVHEDIFFCSVYFKSYFCKLCRPIIARWRGKRSNGSTDVNLITHLNTRDRMLGRIFIISLSKWSKKVSRIFFPLLLQSKFWKWIRRDLENTFRKLELVHNSAKACRFMSSLDQSGFLIIQYEEAPESLKTLGTFISSWWSANTLSGMPPICGSLLTDAYIHFHLSFRSANEGWYWSNW